eukprot:s902_g19.t1
MLNLYRPIQTLNFECLERIPGCLATKRICTAWSLSKSMAVYCRDITCSTAWSLSKLGAFDGRARHISWHKLWEMISTLETNGVPSGHWVGELNLFTGESRKNKLLATEDLSMNAIDLAFAFQALALRFAAHRMYLSMLEGHVHSI